MYPNPINIPLLDIALRPSILMVLLSVVVCFLIIPPWIKSLEGIKPSRLIPAMIVIGFAVFAGGRLHFALNSWEFFGGSYSTVFQIWRGGLHAGGAIAGLALSAPLVLRLFRIPVAKFADGIAPAVGIGIAVARVGCFLNGCCFGTVCDLPWAITFPKDAYIYQYHDSLGVLSEGALRSAPVHPLQLYFVAGGLLLTAVALWLHPRKRYDGQVGLVVLLVYGISAAVLEFFRADYYPRAYWGPLPQLEWMALAITACAAAALVTAEIVHRRRARPPDRAG